MLNPSVCRSRRQFIVAAGTVSIADLSLASPNGNFKLGQSLPLSGGLASYGAAKKLGAEVALAAGRALLAPSLKSIELHSLDDAYSAQKAVENALQFARDPRTIGLVGFFGVPIVDAVIPVAEEQRIPLIGMTSGASNLRSSGYRYAFPVRASYEQEAAKLLDHLKTIQQSRFTVLVQDNIFGAEALKGLQAAIQNKQMPEPQILRLPKDASALPEVLKTISSQSSSIVLLMLSDLAIQSIPLLRKNNSGQALYGLSALDASLLQAKLGDATHGIVQTQVVPSPGSTSNKLVRSYKLAMTQHAPQQALSYFGLEGYIEMRIVVEALKRIKSIPTREALRSALESLGQMEMEGLDVIYRPGLHRGLQFVEMTVFGGRGSIMR